MQNVRKILSVILAIAMIVTLLAVGIPTAAAAAAPYIYIRQDSSSYLAKDSEGYIFIEKGTNVRFWFDTADVFFKSALKSSNSMVMAVTPGGQKAQRYDFTARRLGRCVVSGSYTTKDTETGRLSTRKVSYKIRVVNRGAVTVAAPKISAFLNNAGGVTLRIRSASARNRIFYKKNGTGSWIRLGDVSRMQIDDRTVKPGEVRVYTVRALSAYGVYNSGYSKTGWKVTRLCETPEIAGFINDTYGLRFCWNRPTGAVKFRVFRYESKKWKKLADAAGTEYLDKNAVSGKTYKYTIRCLTKDGKTFTSGYSKSGWSHKYIDSYPVLSKVKVYDNGYAGLRPMAFELENDDRSVAGYDFFVRKDGVWTGTNAIPFAPGNPGAYSDTDRRLLNVSGVFEYGKTYTVTVRGVNDAGKYVTSYSKDGFVIHPLSAPAGIIRTSENRISWTAVPNAVKYQVELKNAAFRTVSSLWTDTNSITDDMLTDFEGYICVTAFDDGICESAVTMSFING